MREKIMRALKTLNSEYFPLYLLLLVSTIFHFPFVLSGFGEADAADLAVTIIDYINHGENGLLTNFYFIDIVPLYVIYIKYFMKSIGNNYSYLITVMNYTNAVIGTLIILPAYLLVKKLFDNNHVAFYTVLTFIFAPSIYRSSIYGFPHLLALFFFITSLYFFAVWLDDTKYIWPILSFITLAATISFKSDFLLGTGAYFGLLFFRKVKDKKKISSSVLIVALSVLSLILLRQWMGINKGHTFSSSHFLDFFINNLINNPFSIGEKLGTHFIPMLYSTGIITFLMASIAIIFYLIKKRFDLLIVALAWTMLPALFWLPFHGYSQSRHYILLVLPFIMIIFLLLHEKAPRFIIFFSIMIILGNYLIPPDIVAGRPGTNLFKREVLIESRVTKLHIAAQKIAKIEGDKIILIPEAFKGYLYYEIFSLIPDYELIKIATESPCYLLNYKGNKCIICINYERESNIKDIITKYHLESGTVILPELLEFNLSALKEKGIKIYRYNRGES